MWMVIPLAVTALLGAFGAYGDPVPVIAVILLVFAAVLIYALRMDLASLVIVTTPIMFYADFGSRVNLSISDIFIVLLAIRALSSPSLAIARQRLRVPVALAAISMLALTAAMTIGILVPSSVPISWQGYFLDLPKLLVVFAYFLIAILVFYDKFRLGDFGFLRVWVITAVTIAALGTIGSVLYDRGVDVGLSYGFRASATFEDPNAYAAFLLASLGVAMAWSYIHRGRVLSISLIPILIGIYFSYSRAAMIAIALIFALSFLLSVGSRALRNVRRLAYGVAAAIIVAFLAGRLENVLESRRDLSIEGDIRLSVWAAAVKVWSDSPFVGVGLGQFRAATASYVETSATPLAHNTYLSFLAEGGIVGLALFLAIPIAVAVLLLRDGGVVSRLFLLSVAGFAIMGASLNLQNSRSIWLLLGIFLGWALLRRTVENTTDAPSYRQMTENAKTIRPTKHPQPRRSVFESTTTVTNEKNLVRGSDGRVPLVKSTNQVET